MVAHWESQAVVPMILEYMTVKPHICFQCLDPALDSFLNENYAKHLLYIFFFLKQICKQSSSKMPETFAILPKKWGREKKQNTTHMHTANFI